MTAQIGEILIYKEQTFSIVSEPLSDYLETNKIEPFKFFETSCWRGYVGYWKISGDKLFITNLKGDDERIIDCGLVYLFPNKKEVFAEWFSGDLTINLGELIEYVHAGFCSIYEKDLIITFDKGIITKQVLVENKSISEDDTDEENIKNTIKTYRTELDLSIKNKINNSSFFELVDMFIESIKLKKYINYNEARKIELNDSNHYSKIKIDEWNSKVKETLYMSILNHINIFYFVLNDLELIPIGAFNSLMNAVNGNEFIYVNNSSIQWLPGWLKQEIRDQGIEFEDLISKNKKSKTSNYNDEYNPDDNMIYAAGSNDPEIMAEAFSNIS